MMNGYHEVPTEEETQHPVPGEGESLEESHSVNASEETGLLSSSSPRIYPRIPRDKWKIVYWIFYFLGMTSLMPWNFFITCDNYWNYKFRNTSAVGHLRPEDRTELQMMFASYLSVASMAPNAIFSILNSILVHKIHVHKRGVMSLVVVTLIFIATTAFVKVDTDKWQMGFLGMTLTLVVLLNMFGGVFMAVVCGLAGRLPPKYMSAVSSGQALGGLIPSIVRIVSLLAGTSPEHAALLYFLIADASIIAALFLYILLANTRFLKFHMRKESIMSSSSGEWENWESLPEDPPPLVLNFRTVFKKIWVYVASLIGIYIVTLGVFPAITVNISSVNYSPDIPINSIFFTPLVCFFLYNFGDYIGRVSASSFEFPGPRRRKLVLVGAVLRVVFIPLFLLCNVQPRNHLPLVFDSDIFFVAFMTVFSFSNGYLTTLCFMHGPGLVGSGEEEAAGSILSTSVSLGTVSGSLISTGLIRIP